MEDILKKIKKIIPKRFFATFQPIYHLSLAFFSALIYRFPSRKITVIGITGTKGKSSTAEILSAILEEAGFKTAISGTIRFKIGENSFDNDKKMSMPGRFFMQKFLRMAVKEKCQYAIIEITSEGAKMYRHKFISLDALIFTNISPEHIESHGSYENYLSAKLSIAKALADSRKKRKILVANADDKETPKFTAIKKLETHLYSIKDAWPYELKKDTLFFTFKNTKIKSNLSGIFNVYNILSAATCAETLLVGTEKIKSAVEKFKGISGRVERINEGQDFEVIVDYAHTTDSMQKLYDIFQESRRICVFGGTGGGRDKWKRPEMGKVAMANCDEIILTTDDPYDENPEEICKDIAKGISSGDYQIILDRREAIKKAFSLAKTGDTVLITGKGSEKHIAGPNGIKIPWNDANVAREELKNS